MRHSRSAEFARALGESVSVPAARWSDVGEDPNDPAALARRAEVLRSAWRPPVPDRIRFLEQRCKGRRVLDVGCVAHDVSRMDSSRWLHAQLASVASRCVGVDVLAEGVDEMRRRGFEVELHDLSTGLGPLAAAAPFDVIVAGELIEHVESLDMLFRTAREALAPDGELVVTTPNPYAPHRVRAAQLGIVWENTDHVLLAFPSGMAELAERHGLLLSEAAVTDGRARLAARQMPKAARRRIRGQQWTTVGYATIGEPGQRRVGYGALGRALHGMWWPGRRFLGETFIYVLRAATDTGERARG